MLLSLEPFAVPLHQSSDGAIRVVGTRIGLDIIVSHFNRGLSPERIAAMLPTLTLADVYAVVAFYLQRREAVDAHFGEEDAQAVALQAEIESQPGYREHRERLLARKSAPAVPK